MASSQTLGELVGQSTRDDIKRSVLPDNRFHAESRLVAGDLVNPVVYYIVHLEDHMTVALDELCHEVGYIGSSDAPTACGLVSAAPEPTLVPVADRGERT